MILILLSLPTVVLGSLFCDGVADNHGCCPACGYSWDMDKQQCVTQKPARSSYCKDLLKPQHLGCCEFCGYTWGQSAGVCVKVNPTTPMRNVPHNNDDAHAAFARAMVRNLTWGVLSTISTRSEGTNVSSPFGNPYSFADVEGVPYLYAAGMDASMIDLFTGAGAKPRASLALSQAVEMTPNGSAAVPACRIGEGTFGDPENPPCARLVLTGTVTKVAKGSAEEGRANKALFKRHPSFVKMPKDHGFYTARLSIDGLWLISAYGGAAIVAPSDYFAASTASAVQEESAVTAAAATEAAPSAVEVVDHPRVAAPWPWQEAKTARWMVKMLSWGVLSTVSTRGQGTNVSDPFGNPYSFADVDGVPYLYGSGLDASMIDLFSAPRASLALSEAALGGEKSLVWREKCQIGTLLGDPENPPCARLVVSGVVSKVASGSSEEKTAMASLVKRHPSFAHYPSSHDFFVAKIAIDGLWLIDIFGGAAIIKPADYFSAS